MNQTNTWEKIRERAYALDIDGKTLDAAWSHDPTFHTDYFLSVSNNDGTPYEKSKFYSAWYIIEDENPTDDYYIELRPRDQNTAREILKCKDLFGDFSGIPEERVKYFKGLLNVLSVLNPIE